MLNEPTPHQAEIIRRSQGPRPLHYTFYLSSGPNREQQREEQRRPSVLRNRKGGPIRRMSRMTTTYNQVKTAVKCIALRQYVSITVNHFINQLKLR